MLSIALAAALVGFMKDGNMFLDTCGKNLSADASTSCQYYVMGVIDDHWISESFSKRAPVICLRDNTRSDELVDVVRRFLVEQPEARSLPAAFTTLLEAVWKRISPAARL